MTKLSSFLKLDFLTIKPYLSVKNLLLFAAIAVFLSAVNGSIQMSLGIGFMLGTLLLSYPFAVGEKNNMDALYVTISVNRKTVVLGRYLFTFLLNACAVAFSFAFATLGVYGARLANVFQSEAEGNPLLSILILSGALVLVQTIQLPIYFKLGYAKAKILSVLPFAAFIAGYVALMRVTSESGALASATSADALGGGKSTALIVLAAILAVYVSYRASLALYCKREF